MRDYCNLDQYRRVFKIGRVLPVFSADFANKDWGLEIELSPRYDTEGEFAFTVVAERGPMVQFLANRCITPCDGHLWPDVASPAATNTGIGRALQSRADAARFDS